MEFFKLVTEDDVLNFLVQNGVPQEPIIVLKNNSIDGEEFRQLEYQDLIFMLPGKLGIIKKIWRILKKYHEQVQERCNQEEPLPHDLISQTCVPSYAPDDHYAYKYISDSNSLPPHASIVASLNKDTIASHSQNDSNSLRQSTENILSLESIENNALDINQPGTEPAQQQTPQVTCTQNICSKSTIPSLPSFSPRVLSALKCGKIAQDFDKFIEEAAYDLINKGDIVNERRLYEEYGRKMFNEYPCISFPGGKTEWSFFSKKLSNKLRNIRWKRQKKDKFPVRNVKKRIFNYTDTDLSEAERDSSLIRELTKSSEWVEPSDSVLQDIVYVKEECQDEAEFLFGGDEMKVSTCGSVTSESSDEKLSNFGSEDSNFLNFSQIIPEVAMGANQEKICISFGNITKLAAINRECLKSTIEIIRRKFNFHPSDEIRIEVKINGVEDYIMLTPEDEEDVSELKKCNKLRITKVSSGTAASLPDLASLLPEFSSHMHRESSISAGIEPNKSSYNPPPMGNLTYIPKTYVSPVEDTQRNIICRKNFNVEQIISNHPKGEKILKDFKKNNFLTPETRKTIIKIVVNALSERCFRKGYPSTEEKHVCAQGIIEAFPCLKSKASATGYSHIFSGEGKHSGYIQDRLRSLRRKHVPLRKRSCRDELNDSTDNPHEDELGVMLPDEELKHHITFCKKTPIEARNDIIQSMKKMHPNRWTWIRDQRPSVNEILDVYPRFIDINEMINVDFTEKYGHETSNKLLVKWECFIAPAILQLARKIKSPAIITLLEEIPDDPSGEVISMFAFMCTVIFLLSYTTKNNQRCSAIFAQQLFIQIKKVGTNVNEFLKNKGETQPFLLCLGTFIKPEQIFVIAGDFAIPCSDDIIRAVDKLFKCHFTFNTEYSCQISNFYKFLEYYIYEMNDSTAVKGLSSNVIELISNLDCIIPKKSFSS